jgi:carboxyl-terminal processing protease
MTSPAPPLTDIAPQEALPPLFITAVLPGSPAASYGLRPGDIIVSVNGAPPFTGGIISAGVMNLLSGPDPQPGRVSVQLQRPATGRTWTVTMTPALYQGPPPPAVSSQLLNADIAYVQLPGFFPGAADQVLQAVTGLATGARLRGVILDLRGNGGGTVADPPGCSAPSPTARPGPTTATCTAAAPPPAPTRTSRCCTCRWSC